MWHSFDDERCIIVDRGTPDHLITKHGRKNLEEVFLELVRNKNEFN